MSAAPRLCLLHSGAASREQRWSPDFRPETAGLSPSAKHMCNCKSIHFHTLKNRKKQTFTCNRNTEYWINGGREGKKEITRDVFALKWVIDKEKGEEGRRLDGSSMKSLQVLQALPLNQGGRGSDSHPARGNVNVSQKVWRNHLPLP